MTQPPAEKTAHQTQARALRDDIQGAPKTLFPRRETILGWLDDYLLRSDRRGFVMEQAETDDLAALELFLRANAVPRAVGA